VLRLRVLMPLAAFAALGILHLVRPSGVERRPPVRATAAAPSAIATPPIANPNPVPDRSLPKESETKFWNEGSARRLLTRILERRSHVQMGSLGRRGLSQFGYERTFYLTEGRLLARLFPDQCEAIASELALNSAQPMADREFGITLLGYLSGMGRRSADAALIRLAGEPEPDLRELAVQSLFPADPTCSYRAFYSEQCREANRAAFKAMSCLEDSSALDFMRDLREGDVGPVRGERRLMAEDLLRKYDLLRSPQCNAELERVLTSSLNPGELDWALRAGQARSLPTLVDSLRKRLDRVMQSARDRDSRSKDQARQEGDTPSSQRFEDAYVTHLASGVMPDFSYDQVLLTLYRSGGPITDLEHRRLAEFGYEGDPQSALRRRLPSED